MTQPRKEQVKNLKTKYKTFTGVGTLVIGNNDLVQKVENTILESFYDNFLNSSITKVVGGAESSSPAILYGGSGPWSLSAGNQFTLTLTGVNGGVPITVTIQAGDIVTLGGIPVVTTSRLAARINSTLSGLGVSYQVAKNVDGKLVLFSANSSGLTVGDSTSFSIASITPSIVTTLGFTQTSSTGTTAPKRGIVTVSNDGLGGVVELKTPSSSYSSPLNTTMLHIDGMIYVPKYPPGPPAFARLNAFPGAVLNGRNFEFKFFRTAQSNPTIVTSQGTNKSNFSTLNASDTISIILNYNGITTSFSTTFTSSPTTAQAVVDAVNAAYALQTLINSGVESTRAAVKTIDGPYRFTNPATRDSFFVSFNAQTPIHINPPAGVYSTAQFATYINSAISLAGQTAQGEAVVPGGADYVVIRSKSTVASVSSVQLLPGNPGGAVPGEFLDTLNELNLSLGMYRGANIAFLHGNDEVKFVNPSSKSGDDITITYSLGTGVKIGLDGTSSTNASTVGPVPTALSTQYCLIPEVSEFSEEPDDYDVSIQEFNNKGDKPPVNPLNGVGNLGENNLLGSDGKINPNFLNSFLGFLGLERLNLGKGLTNNGTNQTTTPRINTEYDPSINDGLTLLYEGTSNDSSYIGHPNRVYIGDGRFYITQNAFLTSAGTWNRDDATLDSYFLEFSSGDFSLAHYNSADSAPWVHGSWRKNTKINTSSLSKLVVLGENLESVNSTIARIAMDGDSATSGQKVLLLQAKDKSNIIPATRVYVSFSGILGIEITWNANWTGTEWEKDVSGTPASRFALGETDFSVSYQVPDTNWNVWDNQINTNLLTSLTKFLGSVNIGDNLGSSGDPRLMVKRQDPGGGTPTGMNRRTLLLESEVNGSGAIVPIRIYLDHSTATLGAGVTFTFNCMWNEVSGWVQDDPTSKSFAWSSVDSRFYLYTKAASSSPWSESTGAGGWDQFDGIDRSSALKGFVTKDGAYKFNSPTTSGSNPIFNDPNVELNSVYAKNTVKSWGIGAYFTGTISGVPGLSIFDGYNFDSIASDGGSGWDSFFVQPLSSTAYMVQFTYHGTPGGGYEAATTTFGVAKARQTLTNKFSVYAQYLDGNLIPTTSWLKLSHIVLGLNP